MGWVTAQIRYTSASLPIICLQYYIVSPQYKRQRKLNSMLLLACVRGAADEVTYPTPPCTCIPTHLTHLNTRLLHSLRWVLR